jgi:hypothetical protein
VHREALTECEEATAGFFADVGYTDMPPGGIQGRVDWKCEQAVWIRESPRQRLDRAFRSR